MNDHAESAPPSPIRAFLDANVLMAAALGGGCAKLWHIANVQLVTSEYAAREAWENLQDAPTTPSPRQRLADLLAAIEVITDQDPSPEQAARWSLRDPKDVPILAGAINSRCTFLVTADVACFGEHMRGPPFHGVRVLKPGVFLQHLGISKPNHNI